MLQYLQRIGKAILLPIAVLPIAGIFLGLGGALLGIASLENAPELYYPLIKFINIPLVTEVLTVMNDMGNIIFNNLPALFAVGVAAGLANKDKGTAALASIFGFLVMNQVVSTLLALGVTQLGVVTADNVGAYSTYVTTNLGIFTLNMSVFGGIITGIVTAVLHNKYDTIQLPAVIGFFSGSRFVPIVTALAMAFIGTLLAFIWPEVQKGIGIIANVVRDAGPVGTFFYGVIERALIPFGLHHVFYTPFWYGSFVEAQVLVNGSWQTVAGANTAYFIQLSNMSDLVGANADTMRTVVNGTTRFMAGKFPFMMFGLPAAALAIYRTASPSKKKVVGSLLISAAVTSFLTGITEPLEFTFLFAAPLLYVVHCFLAGLSFFLMNIFNVFIGMTFSGGLIDFTLFGLLPAGAGVHTNWFRLILIGLCYGTVYYFTFLFIIKKFQLNIPVRLEDEEVIKLNNKLAVEENSHIKEQEVQLENSEDEIERNVPVILKALGGEKNIVSVDACITRLRVEVKDKSQVNKEILEDLGAAGVMEVGNGIQVIFGAKADIYKNAINDILDIN